MFLIRGELFTETAAGLAGEPLRAKVVRSTHQLDDQESDLLATDPEASGLYRTGQLVTVSTGRVAADITSVTLTERIYDKDIAAILQDTDVPLGMALEPLLGFKRSTMRIVKDPDPEHILLSTALLTVTRPDGRLPWAVAIATEMVRPVEGWVR
jgi:hypothetical protein